MEQPEFLTTYVFKGLTNVHESKDENAEPHFSEKDFEAVLERCEYFGIGIYTIESFSEGKSNGKNIHEEFRKKATDAAWYNKAFSTFRMTTPGMTYAGTYKVSLKLLARY